ncbi:ScbA/BarX family gamma-butyrolactone biosynthesis protein [Nocardia sp. NPDC005366]|uniref:ScbA/BarX family gamma-butyrolactone biosynthesis protein n=1 Tax=Nocardia sp. NPDC005366 TaxID=3156878 RepID=UPI0033BF2AC5
MDDLLTNGRAGERRTLGFDQAVPRSLAHRSAVAEVFVTDTAPAGGDEFLAAVQLPRAHALWFDRLVTYHDPLAVLEAVRQSLLVIGQRYLGVPADAPASLQRMGLSVDDLSLFHDDERTPLEAIVRIRSDQTSADSGYFRDVSFEAAVTIDGARAMTVRGGGIAFPRDAYEELRALQQNRRGPSATTDTPPLDPNLFGRRDPRNIVLGRPDERLILVVDQRHPSFFDHPYDHVPGPLLIEAFRQAALVAATEANLLDAPVAAVTELRAEFTEFIELDADIECVTEISPGSAPGFPQVRIGLHQYGKQIADGAVELSSYPPIGTGIR